MAEKPTREWLSNKIARFLPNLRNLQEIDLELTNHCNTNCLMCPRYAIKRPFGYVEIDTVRNLLNQMKETGIEGLAICGFGEPTLHKDFFKIVELCFDIYPDIALSLVSNFQVLSDDDIKRLGNYPFRYLDFSWSGIRSKDYAHLMGKDIFDDQVKRLSLLLQSRNKETQVRLRYIFTHPHPNRQKDIIRYFKKWQDLKLMLVPSHNRGGYLTAYSTSFRKHTVFFRCDYLRYVTFITWQGEALLCPNDLIQERSFGNINTSSLEDIISRRQASEGEENWPIEACKLCSNPLKTKLALGYNPRIIAWVAKMLEP